MKPDANISFIEVEREFSFGSWVLQMFVVYCLPSLVMAVIEDILKFGDTIGTLIFEYLAVVIAGWALARFAAYVSDDPGKEGSMIWVLPVLLELVCILSSLLSGSVSELYGLFVTFGPGHGEESLLLALVTIPTIGCCAYSAVIRRLAWCRARGR